MLYIVKKLIAWVLELMKDYSLNRYRNDEKSFPEPQVRWQMEQSKPETAALYLSWRYLYHSALYALENALTKTS